MRSETRQEAMVVGITVVCFALAVLLTAIWNPPPENTRPRVPVMVNTTVDSDGMMVEWTQSPEPSAP